MIDPCIPKKWQEFAITYRYGTATYRITVKNPRNISRGVHETIVDGVKQQENEIILAKDGKDHTVEIIMG